MTAWRSWAGFVACVGAAFFLVSTGAAAKSGYIAFPGGRTGELSLTGSHGYAIDIAESNRRSFELVASKDQSAAIYSIRHNPERDNRVEATLPGLGRISVRFHPKGRVHREAGLFESCKGGESVTQPGYFVGTIRFRGERGYTALHATRAQGQTVTTTREVCKRSIFGSGKPNTKDLAFLSAKRKSHGRTTSFAAFAVGDLPDSLTLFFSTASEQREGMSISRRAIVMGGIADFTPGDAGDFPLSATVEPPNPFHGSATFQRKAGSDNAWTGSLSAAFPGAGRIALAGPRFTAKLCQDAGCARLLGKGSAIFSRSLARDRRAPQRARRIEMLASLQQGL